jgi:ubiquitin carboxyl-terminal hydrolase 48
MAHGLSARNNYPFCANAYVASQLQKPPAHMKEETMPDDDIVVVSDDESVKCTKKGCKVNPNCLNYLGQDMWEDKGKCLDDAQVFLSN